MRSLLRSLASLALAPILCVTTTVASAHGGDGASARDIDAQIERVRRATARFSSVEAAAKAGYAQFMDCVAEPGAGAMGTHYLNGELVGDAVVEALRPEALMYETKRNGTLELIGVEYIVFQDAWDAQNPQPPVLFGHPFHLVRSPNRYGVPAFYELHLWLWKRNPNGIFNDWNPRVRCR